MAEETTTTTTTETPAAPTTPAAEPTTEAEKVTTFDAKYVEGLRQEAAKHRTATNAAKAELDALKAQFAKALGVGDDKKDPEELQKAIAAKDAELRSLKVEGRVRALAAKAQADPDALLDSRSFQSALADLDPSAATFETDLSAAMTAAVAANARLKVGGQAPPRGGTEINGGNAAKPSFTREQLRDPDFYAANEKDILAAWKEGRITAS